LYNDPHYSFFFFERVTNQRTHEPVELVALFFFFFSVEGTGGTPFVSKPKLTRSASFFA
jgi:hypothetical protein